MAAILRQQVAALIADVSSNKVSVSGTQASLTSTQSTVTLTSSGLNDISNNLYRVAKYDASRNATLQNISSLVSSREIYNDAYTYPNGIGQYQIDAIPVLLKDKFKMPKFSSNRIGEQYKNSSFYDTAAAAETVVYVPSKRTTIQTTNIFSQTTANTTNNLGHFQISLEDWAVLRNGKTNQSGWLGTSLADKVQSFVTAATSPATTDASRNALLQAIVTDADYATIKNNVKLPFKVWNQVKDGNGGFQFSNLLDLSGVAIKNQLVDNSYFNSQVVESSWPLDINGVPTEILPVAQNVNAINSKMGLFIYFLGNGQLQADPTSMLPSLIASLGYIVLVCAGNPINGDGLVTKSSTTISKLLADKVIDLSLNSSVNDYYISPNTCYGAPDNTTVGSGSYNRINFRNSGMAPEAQPIFERYIYQQICILKKLGLYDLIDWNNVVAGGMSGGGYALNIVHDMLNNNGKTRYFTLNNLDGSSKNIYPDLVKVKALVGNQTVHYELSRLTEDQKIPAAYTDDIGRNNQYNIGINVLKCPMVYITGDGDAYSRSLPYENLFNSNAQTIFQLTKKQGDSATDIILSQCAVIYKPTNGHLTSVATTNDFTEAYVGSLWLNWLNGGSLIPKNVTLPELNNIAATGLNKNVAYMQYDDYKSLIVMQLVAHRFLGNNYPLPSSAYSTVGWRVDLMPTHCDITTEHQYMKVGPRTLLGYDASYNLTLTTGATNTGGNLIGNTASLSVDASKNLVTDANSITFSNKKIYADKYTLPTPTGPYNVDCIPIQIKDQFLMPKFGANRTGDNAYYNGKTSVGSSGESVTISYTNNLHTDNTFNTYVAPELDIYVPSNRTSFQTTNMFRDGSDGVGTVPNAGTISTALEDALLLGLYSNSITGSSALDTFVTTFKTSVQSSSTTQEARTTALNNILTHGEYIALKNNMKYPFKVWDNKIITDTDGKRKFSYSNLDQVKTDISNNGVAIPMLTNIGSGNYTNTLVADSQWPQDASGNPTAILPVSSNVNAISNKMGLLLLFNGTSSNTTANSTLSHFAYNLASYGYVSVACHGSPLNGSIHRFEGPKTISKALADRNTDPSGMPFISYDTSNNLLDSSAGCYWRSDNKARNTYFIPSSQLYNETDGIVTTGEKGFEANRLSVKTMISTPAAKKVYQRYFYQIKCVLEKLGILQYINLDNVLVGGLSGGGFAPIAFHQLLVESPATTPSLSQPVRTVSGGISTVYRCNNANGTESSVYPKLGKLKAFFNLQSNVGNDLSLVPDTAFNPNLTYTNNGLSAPVKKLLVPMITITSDFDTTSSAPATSATPMRDNFYNHQAQIVYQLTQKSIETNGAYSESNAILALAKSVILYRPSSQHTPATGPIASGDGEYDAAYAGNSFSNWINGWELNQYVQFPNIGRTVDSIGSELAYQQEEDIKTTIASTLIAHRFLGNDFPIPQVALDNLGIRYDIGPLSCDVNTDFEFMKVGPKTQISYDTSYNLQITAPGLTLTSISSAPPINNYDYVSLAPVGQATIRVDTANKLVTDATGMTFAGFNLSTDSYGNLIIG